MIMSLALSMQCLHWHSIFKIHSSLTALTRPFGRFALAVLPLLDLVDRGQRILVNTHRYNRSARVPGGSILAVIISCRLKLAGPLELKQENCTGKGVFCAAFK